MMGTVSGRDDSRAAQPPSLRGVSPRLNDSLGGKAVPKTPRPTSTPTSVTCVWHVKPSDAAALSTSRPPRPASVLPQVHLAAPLTPSTSLLCSLDGLYCRWKAISFDAHSPSFSFHSLCLLQIVFNSFIGLPFCLKRYCSF